FYGRPVHLLGGSPKRQKELWEDPMLDVVSCDSNYLGKISDFCMAFYQGKYRKLRDVYLMVERGAPYYAFELSCINTWLYWNDLDWGVRFAKPEDLTRIKELADRNKKDIGFI